MALTTLTVDLNASIGKFEQDLKRAVTLSQQTSGKMTTAFGSISNSLRSLAPTIGLSAIAAVLVHGTKAAIDNADQMGKVSQRTGIAVESLSALKYAAGLADVEFEALTKGLQIFNKNIDKGSEGFKRLGLDVKSFKSPDDALGAVAERFLEIEDGAGKTAVAMELFGKSGAALIPMLNGGRQSLAALREEAQRLGIIISPQQAAEAEKFNDNVRRLKASFSGLFQELSGSILPALNSVLEATIKGRIAFGSYHESFLAMLSVPTDFFATTAEQIEDISAQLEGLKARQTELREGGWVNAAENLQGNIDMLTKVKTLKEGALKVDREARAEQVLAGRDRNAILDANDARAKKAATKKETLADPFANATALIKAQSQNQLDAVKQAGTEQQAMSDIFYARGIISHKQYFTERIATTQAGFRAEIVAVQKELAEERIVLAHATEGTDKIQAQAAIERSEGQIKKLRSQIAFAKTQGLEQLKDAEKDLDDQLAQTNAQLQAQGNHAEAAALAQFDLAHALERTKLVTQFGADSQPVKNLDLLRQEVQLRGQLTDVEREEALIKLDIATKDQAIANAFLTGGPDAELAALTAANQLRREEVARLDEVLKAKERIAIQANDKTGQAQLALERAQLDAMTASASGAAEAMARLNIAQRHTGVLLGHERNAEGDIANLRTSGAITSMEALRRTDEVRKASLVTLRAQLALEEQEAAATGSEEARLHVDELRVSIDALAASSNEAARVYTDVFESGFASAFQSFADGSKTAGESFDNFSKSIADGLMRIASQQLAEQIFGGAMSSGGSGGAGWVGMLAGLFGGSGSGASASASYSNAMEMGGIMTKHGPLELTRYARGGIARRPQMALFGEGRKPEAYVPLPDGRRIPVNLGGAAGGGPPPVNVVMNITTPDANSFRKSNSQILTELQSSLARAGARR